MHGFRRTCFYITGIEHASVLAMASSTPQFGLNVYCLPVFNSVY